MAESEEIKYTCDNEGNEIDKSKPYIVIYKVSPGAELKALVFENESCLAEFLLPQNKPYSSMDQTDLRKLLEEAL